MTSWSWSFGDGSTSSVQNPSHSYAAIARFNANSSARTRTVLPSTHPGPSIVFGSSIVNGAFDAEDLSGWAVSGNAPYVLVTSSPYEGMAPLTGAHYALLGTSGSLEFLSQSVTTVPQQVYFIVAVAWQSGRSDAKPIPC